MTDLELALKYSPYILFDKAEPFDVKGMGYSIFRQSDKSKSFDRSISIDKSKVDFAIEYAVYFDYDIQHLYDLEHIWVYVDYAGNVCDAEASFHGRYFKSLIFDENGMENGTHARFYCQPGKHAFLPDGKLFKLKPDWYTSCNEFCGEDGLLVKDMFQDQLPDTPELQRQVRCYIKKHFAFQPTLQFQYKSLDDSVFMTWEELKVMVPTRIKRELETIHKEQICES